MAMVLPRLTPEALRSSILEMCDISLQMLRLTRETFLRHSQSSLEQVASMGRDLHLREKRLTDHVAMQLCEYPWSLGSAEHFAFLPGGLERIGDSVEAVARCVSALHREGLPFSDSATRDVLSLFDFSVTLVEQIAAAIRTGNREGLESIREEGRRFQTFSDHAAHAHQERLIRGLCVPKTSSFFLAMLDYFREIERYTHRMSLELEKALIPD